MLLYGGADTMLLYTVFKTPNERTREALVEIIRESIGVLNKPKIKPKSVSMMGKRYLMKG